MSNQRRVIPAGTKLTVGVTSVAPFSQEPPTEGYFKPNQYPAQVPQEHFVSVRSSGRIDLILHCRNNAVWVAPNDLSWDFSDVVTVGTLSSAMKFTADKEKLTG